VLLEPGPEAAAAREVHNEGIDEAGAGVGEEIAGAHAGFVHGKGDGRAYAESRHEMELIGGKGLFERADAELLE